MKPSPEIVRQSFPMVKCSMLLRLDGGAARDFSPRNLLTLRRHDGTWTDRSYQFCRRRFAHQNGKGDIGPGQTRVQEGVIAACGRRDATSCRYMSAQMFVTRVLAGMSVS